jgi:LuxR family maltose regulon positive regulatory protein
MASETISGPLLSTKLNRPPVGSNIVHRPHLLERLDRNRRRPLTLVSAPAGYGKTMLVSSWLEASSIPSAWVSLDESDNDAHLFLSYFLSAVRSLFPDACSKTLAMASVVPLPPPAALANNLNNELDRIEPFFIMVLDDYQLIKQTEVFELLALILAHPPQSLHLVLIGRRDPPIPIATMRGKSQVTEIRTQDLRFNEMETARYLTQELGTQVDASIATALTENIEGWVTGLHLATLSMRHRHSLDSRLLEPQADTQYVREYLFNEVFSSQPPQIIQYLLGSAILDRFCGPLCEAVCIPGADPLGGEFSGWDFIAWLKQENMFLIPLDAEGQWFRFHRLFKKFLFSQLERHLSSEDINDLHAKAGAWFAENGPIEEALKHALISENSATAKRLVVSCGFKLLNEERWSRLERWLRMLPGDTLVQAPELLVLNAWTHAIYARYTELGSCLDKAEALYAVRTTAEHLPGHLDALRGFHHYLAVNGEEALACLRRAIEKTPKNHRWVRIFAFIVQAAAYQILGDLKMTLATIRAAMRDPDLDGGISQGYFRANPCLIYWMEADLLSMLQTAERSLKLDEGCRAHRAIAHGLYFSGIAHYHRNELKAAEEKLAVVVEDPCSQQAWNFAHSAFALALTHQARGRTDAANQVGESVTSYALDTRNPVVLKVAQAFQAELALRQGRLAVACNWAAQFVSKPFLPMCWFYVPQLTLVKVLLAQDTTKSREYADDLLKQLYEFVVFTHSTRFQIDVLTLQALLYDSRGEGPTALERLAKALDLAESGGFIRLFVDLGSQMADLLRQLINRNVAVSYGGKILAAFKGDEQRARPGKSDHPIAHHLPLKTQPLVEPLTNRELEIMDLLSQRLRNNEIAAQLFVSPQTIKKHLYNIYGKLNVSGRRQAVKKASQLNIL